MIDLEQQLRNYGAAIGELIDSSHDAEPVRPKTSRRPVARVGALTLIAACVVGVAAVSGRSDDNGAAGTASPDPTATPAASAEPAPVTAPTPPTEPTIDWPNVAVDACVAEAASHPIDWGEPPSSADPTVIVPLVADSTSVRVTITGADATASCTVELVGGQPQVSSPSYGKTRERAEVDVDGVVVDDQSWMSDTEIGDTGPGWYETSGRAGGAVVSISVSLGDGTTVVASLDNGHFYGKVDAAAGAPLFEERISWTLTDGTTHSRRADLLDEQTTEELCAATADCVEARLSELQADASGTDAAALSDLVITDDEYSAALQRIADCANAAGGDVTVKGRTMSVSEPSTAAFEECQRSNPSLVFEAWNLIRARDRANEPSS